MDTSKYRGLMLLVGKIELHLCKRVAASLIGSVSRYPLAETNRKSLST
jgi:hypothetical protein